MPKRKRGDTGSGARERSLLAIPSRRAVEVAVAIAVITRVCGNVPAVDLDCGLASSAAAVAVAVVGEARALKNDYDGFSSCFCQRLSVSCQM